jgi:hypothetical protein
MGNGQFSNWSPGNRFEIEFFPEDKELGKTFSSDVRYFADYEWISFGTAASESLNQWKFGVAASWWIMGNLQRFIISGTSWQAVRKAELNVFVGPTLQKFSELQTNVITNQIIGVSHPLLIGMQVGSRACIPIFNMTCIDVSGRAIIPIYITNVKTNSMKFVNSISFHWSAVLDHSFHRNFSIGLGVIGSLSRLDYINQSSQEQKTSVFLMAPTLSGQFRF